MIEVMNVVAAILTCFLAVATISAQTKQSDREFAGLKGSVKSVFTEKADAKLKAGRVVESDRREFEYFIYSPGGAAASSKGYDPETGELLETHTYMQIDGDKVLKIEMNSGAAAATASTDAIPAKRKDPRYDYKFKYKFDDRGRIVEEAWWQSDGDIWLRYVYEYAPGERRELAYDKDGALNLKSIYKLDPKGNEIEAFIYDPDADMITSRERFEYVSFDPVGNWTKRIEYEAEGNKTSKFKPREIKYRTLTYY